MAHLLFGVRSSSGAAFRFQHRQDLFRYLACHRFSLRFRRVIQREAEGRPLLLGPRERLLYEGFGEGAVAYHTPDEMHERIAMLRRVPQTSRSMVVVS